jgi:hypothetical protein
MTHLEDPPVGIAAATRLELLLPPQANWFQSYLLPAYAVQGPTHGDDERAERFDEAARAAGRRAGGISVHQLHE